MQVIWDWQIKAAYQNDYALKMPASFGPAVQTPVIQLEEALSPRTAAKEAHEVCMILAEIQKVEGMLEHTRLSQLDNLLPDLGSEFVLNADCRTQRRLGDIDFEMISRWVGMLL